MSSGISNFLANELLDHAYSGAVYTPPATVYVGLFTARGTPAQASANTGITAVTGGSYARVAVTNNATNWPAAVSMVKSNGTAITFIQASADWGTVIGFTIYDAASGGNLLHWGDLTTPKSILTGDILSFAVGALDIMEGICA